jgi:hypothetical protein
MALLDVRIPGKSKGAKLVRAYQPWAHTDAHAPTTPTVPSNDAPSGAVQPSVDGTPALRLI